MVRCARGALYTGISPRVPERVAKHNAGKGAKAVKALGLPVVLKWSREVGSKGEALMLEARLKKMTKAQKEEWIMHQ